MTSISSAGNPYTVKVTSFEGPLDVLLDLIESKKMEVTRISLAEVTNQFIAYVEKAPIPPGILADFLAVAARLLILKAKALLPFLTLSKEEEEELVDFEARLRLLQQFRSAGKTLRSILKRRRYAFGRESSTVFSVTFYPPENVDTDVLHGHFRRIADEYASFFAAQEKIHATLGKVVSLEERIRDVMRMVEGAIERRFDDMVKDAKTKMDIIVTFIAMLELVKQRLVDVEQGGIFGDIKVRKSKEE